MDGQASYLTAGHNPNLKVVVCFYPGCLFNPLGSGQDTAPFDVNDNIKCPILVLSGATDTNPSHTSEEARIYF
jgi:dienelactone hydrolase